MSFIECLLFRVSFIGSSTEQVGVLHNDLATALDGAGQFSDAESHARTSLGILSGSHDDSTTEHQGRVYYNLGMILSHQGLGLVLLYWNLLFHWCFCML